MKVAIRILTLVLVFVLLPNTIFAQIMFTDVDENHWAKEYIEDVVKLGFMDGYNDGTFRPNGKVDRLDALTMACKLMGYNKDELKAARVKKNNFVNGFTMLSEGEKDILSYGIVKGIVKEKFVSEQFFKDGIVTDAEKLEVSIYIARAMGLEEEAKKRGSVLLYKDAELISNEACPYVDLLIQKGVLSSTGDSEGKFNPRKTITRAAMAKMLSVANAEINPKGDNAVEPIENPIELKDNQLLGSIVAKAGDFIIVESMEKKDSYKIVKDTIITVDGNRATLGELEKGMTVKITVGEGNILSSVECESTNDILNGTIVGISLGANPNIKLKLEDNSLKSVYLASDTKIVINGKESQTFMLKNGDNAKVEVINNLATKVLVESENGSLTGKLVEKKSSDGYVLVINREDGSNYEYQLAEDVKINRNGSVSDFEKLRRKDEVYIVFVDGYVTEVNSKATRGEDSGEIVEIHISEEPYIGIKRDEEIERYYLKPKGIIKVDGSLADVYSLRLNQNVKLKYESDEAIEINIDTKINREK